MIRTLKVHVLKIGVSTLLVGLIAIGAFAMNSVAAFAQVPCSPSTSLAVPNTPVGASADCVMGIMTNLSGGLSFSNAATATTDGNVPVTSGGVTVNYGFGTTVADFRNTQDGWKLQAASAGLVNGSTTIPLLITNSTSTCVPSSPSSSCVDTTATPITLTALPQTFLSTGNPANIISGTFTIQTNGTYTFPGNAPAGAYMGTITVALVNTF